MAMRFGSALFLFAALLLVTSSHANNTAFTYSMVYDVDVGGSDFSTGRGAGIDTYVAAWGQATIVDTSGFTASTSIRNATAINMNICGNSNYALFLRQYVDGDANGLFEVALRTRTNGLSQSQAETRSIAPASSATSAVRGIERVASPCDDQYAAASTVTFTSAPTIATCADVAALFPGSVTSSSTAVTFPAASGFTYVYTLSGTYDGFSTQLSTLLSYATLSNAQTDTGLQEGTFEYSVLGSNSGATSFSTTQITSLDSDYSTFVNIVGSDDIPCESSAASPSSNTSNDSSNSSNDSSNSSNGSSNGSSNNSPSSDAVVIAVPTATVLIASLLVTLV